MDLIGLLIVATALIAVPTVPALISARRSGVAETQLRNGSEGNFRDVFEAFMKEVHNRFDGLHADQKAQREDIQGLHNAILEERTARRHFETRIEDRLDS